MKDSISDTPITQHSHTFTDTHCHLDLRQFDPDRDAAIARAAAVGVATIINPGVDLASCRRILALADRHTGVYAAVGVHPNDCADFDDDTVAQLRRLAIHPKVVAIGEIGLDYYWHKVPVEQQKRALRAQLTLAAELDLPVILHSRSAQGDDRRQCNAELLSEVAQWTAELQRSRNGASLSRLETPIPDSRFSALRTVGVTPEVLTGVWHAFSGDLAQAQAAYDSGLVLGLGGPVTFQNARGLHALTSQLRLDRLLLETDAPYLTPHPHRGQRNEPAYIPLIAEKLAGLFNTTVESVCAQTTVTARRLFEKMTRCDQA